ncbi:hypothetical protein [Salinispora arenicola]|uniref:hypothetical protein n=1 Tax=Salinispora arenicola TaxID=168697 RepID=UPI0003727C12|nr:hypothetical protein [Salinispora arenicola]
MTSNERTTGPGPMPDLSTYQVRALSGDAAYEWYLSDHPWAAAERRRRRAAELQYEIDSARKVQEWIERTRAADAGGDLADRPAGWRDNLIALAEGMAPVVAANHTHASFESAEPDDLWVANARRKLETSRRVEGDRTYTYPAHLLGPGAAAYPPPGWTVSR